MHVPVCSHTWPDLIDLTATLAVFGLLLGVCIAGHVMCLLDIRAWIRSLRRALVVVTRRMPQLTSWSQIVTPRCLRVFGLSLPCTEQQLLAAYRQRVKRLHPDMGGDDKQFMRLQADFEESLSHLRRFASD